MSKAKSSLDERIQQLVAFEAQHGHTLVPRSHKSGLGVWVKNMRFQRTQGKVKSDVMEKLNAVKFVWVAPKAADKEKVMQWGKHFKWLHDFVKAKGHCRVPATIAGKPTPAAEWCNEQRRLFMENKLGSDEMEKLQKIGFDFYGELGESAKDATVEEPVSFVYCVWVFAGVSFPFC